MRPGNAERNSFVREQITGATLELLKEKPLNQIAINEIAERAGVSRISFYRNYVDKEDILRTHLRTLFAAWSESDEVKSIEAQELKDELLGNLFGYLIKNKEFFILLQRRDLLYLFRGMLKEIYGIKKVEDNATAYVLAYFFYGLYGWIEEWIERGMPESAEEITRMLKNRNLM